MEDTLIRVNFEFVLFLAGESVTDVKAARIRAYKKGGYAHKSKCESEK